MISRNAQASAVAAVVLTCVATMFSGIGGENARRTNDGSVAVTADSQEAPVLMVRLEYDGDRNNRPNALGNLCRWAEETFEARLSWRSISVAAKIEDWPEAPLLVVSGTKTPNFSDGDIAKLRTYVEQGGTLFSIAENGGEEFARAMRETYKKIFPKYDLMKTGRDDEVNNSLYRLSGQAKLSVVSNGVRPVVFHSDADLTQAWQQNDIAAARSSFEAASNVIMCATGKKFTRPIASRWPQKQAKDCRSIRVARIRYDGNYDPEPLALERLSRRLANQCGLKLEIARPQAEDATTCRPVDGLTPSELTADVKIAFMTGTGEFRLKGYQKDALRKWVDGGGLLVVDIAGGVKGFSEKNSISSISAKILIRELWGEDSLHPLPQSCSIYHAGGMTIEAVKYRAMTLDRLGMISEPLLRGVCDGDRLKVIYSEEDITAGLAGCIDSGIDGYSCESAYGLMRNLCISIMPEQVQNDIAAALRSAAMVHQASSGGGRDEITAAQPDVAPSNSQIASKEIRKLIARLDDDNYRVRDEATRKLINFGERVLPTVEKMLYDRNVEPEVIERLKVVADNIVPGSSDCGAIFGPFNRVANVVYLVDSSGSMIRSYGWIQRSLLASIEGMNDYSYFNLIFFGRNSRLDKAPKMLVPASMDNKMVTSAFMKKMTPAGPTDPVPALKLAFEAVNAGDRPGGRMICLISDGLFPDRKALLDAISSLNPPGERQVAIQTFLVGKRTMEGEATLKKIAADNKGSYSCVDSYEEDDD